MAVSAFKDGMLKKNPFLGSSLLDDPNRSAELGGLREIYSEAKADPNAGRAGMLAKLAQRYREFGLPQMQRLSEINKQKADMQAINYHDPEAEGKLAKDVNLWQDFAKNYAAQTGRKKKNANQFLSMSMHNKEIAGKAQEAWDLLTDEERMAFYVQPKMEYGLVRPKPDLKKVTKEFLGQYIGKHAAELARQQQDQQAAIAKKYADLNAQYQPLLQEQQQRQGALAQRANLYNEFLGMGPTNYTSVS